MNGTQSRTLVIGNRVTWKSDTNDMGTVSAKDWAGVKIKWNNRSEQSILHNDMGQVDLVRTKAK